MLTHKKRLFAEARHRGLNMTKAAIAAGCPEKTAQPAGSRYERDADVIAYRERLKSKDVSHEEPTKDSLGPDQEQAGNFDDPLEFLKSVMNNQVEDPKLRLEAAKALASYTVAKPGEKGKKQEQQERAGKASGKFGVPTPPSLKAVK